MHTPPATYAILPIGWERLVFRYVLCGVAHDAFVGVRLLDVDSGPALVVHTAANDGRPGLPQPAGGDKRRADDQEVIVRRASALWLKFPDAAPAGELPPCALYPGIKLALPCLPFAWVGRGIGQGNEEQAAAHVRDRDGAERLLQPGARAAGELAYLATGLCPRIPVRPSKRAAQLRAGAAHSGDDARGPALGEVWTVDKVSARLGARRAAEEYQRALSRVIGNSFTIASVLGQGSGLTFAYPRAPPGIRRRSRCEIQLRYRRGDAAGDLSMIPERIE